MSNKIFFSYKFKCDPIDLALPQAYLDHLAAIRGQNFYRRNHYELPPPNFDQRLMDALINIGFKGFKANGKDRQSSYPNNTYTNYSSTVVYDQNFGKCELVYASPTQINVRLDTLQSFHDQFAAELNIKANPKSKPTKTPACAPNVIHRDIFDNPIEVNFGILYPGDYGLQIGKVVGWTKKQIRVVNIKAKSNTRPEFVYSKNSYILDQDLFVLKILQA